MLTDASVDPQMRTEVGFVVALVGLVAIAVLAVAAWAVKRWKSRSDDEERQQILLCPGAGSKACSLQTRNIQFAVPPSVPPYLDYEAEDEQNLDSSPSSSSNVTDVPFERRCSTPTFARCSAFDLRRNSITDIHKTLCADTRRGSGPDFCKSPTNMRRRSFQGYSLGSLNPELYRMNDFPDDFEDFPEGHLGRLFFSIKYDQDLERLLVVLYRIKNLPSRSPGSATSCDGYVRISVLPDDRRFLQTRIKKKTCNPVFDEHFGFQVAIRNLNERTLKFTVVDSGRPRRQATIGHLLYPLNAVLDDPPSSYITSRDLTKEETVVQEQDLGEILLSLCYNSNINRLTLTVFEARGVKNATETPTQVKVTFLDQWKVVKTKKTASSDRLQFNESFHFKAPSIMEGTHLNIQLRTIPSSSKGHLLGRILLGSYMFARGQGLTHWNEAISNPGQTIQKWQPLTQ